MKPHSCRQAIKLHINLTIALHRVVFSPILESGLKSSSWSVINSMEYSRAPVKAKLGQKPLVVFDHTYASFLIFREKKSFNSNILPF
jgi:hypothetical protein